MPPESWNVHGSSGSIRAVIARTSVSLARWRRSQELVDADEPRVDISTSDEDVLDPSVPCGDVAGEALEVERAETVGDGVGPSTGDVEVAADLVLAMRGQRHQRHAPEALQREVEEDELRDVRQLDDHDVTGLVAEVAEVTGEPHRSLADLAERELVVARDDRRLVGVTGERGLVGRDQRLVDPVPGRPGSGRRRRPGSGRHLSRPTPVGEPRTSARHG